MNLDRIQLARLLDRKASAARYDWPRQARPNQLLPAGGWNTCVVMAGRGFGKTRMGCEAVRVWIKQGFRYVNLIGATAEDARQIMVEGESGILAVCPDEERPEYLPSKSELRWPNGAVSMLLSADEPDRFRGKQSDKAWLDELMAFRWPEQALDQARFGLRLGSNPQMLITTTPRPSKLLRALLAEPGTVVIRGTSFENRKNLAEQFYSTIIAKYQGTRLGRQELLGEIIEDNPGALFHAQNIEENRVTAAPADLGRIVVAIDPAVTSNEESDETGIIVCGRDQQSPPRFFVLADDSTIASPDAWARKAVVAYRRHRADRIIGESNNGGEMIEAVVRHVDPNISYKSVHATRGKVIRAEPIAALYEQGRVHHVGTFADLESQLTEWNPESSDSPDRMDALVWALTELSEGFSGTHGLVEYLKSGQAEADLDRMCEPLPSSRPVHENALAAMPTPPVAPTPTCPECGADKVTRVSGQVHRCLSCWEQFEVPGKFKIERGPSRAALLSRVAFLGGRRTG